MTTTEHDYRAQARQAIEIVCAGDLSRMEEFYRPDFVDHINDMTFHGYHGGRESVTFYLTIFKNLRMDAEEQITEGNRVASRWVLNGTYRRRPITLQGITISRFAEDGRIVEDRGHSDSIALVRQLGLIRTLLLGLEILTRRVKLPKGALGG
ncbi:MAG TPA: ester cyclase [Solirubrobacteraceae bacterium]|nr:ester cyclase [Solirubrobacteraceae bacterium]